MIPSCLQNSTQGMHAQGIHAASWRSWCRSPAAPCTGRSCPSVRPPGCPSETWPCLPCRSSRWTLQLLAASGRSHQTWASPWSLGSFRQRRVEGGREGSGGGERSVSHTSHDFLLHYIAIIQRYGYTAATHDKTTYWTTYVLCIILHVCI